MCDRCSNAVRKMPDPSSGMSLCMAAASTPSSHEFAHEEVIDHGEGFVMCIAQELPSHPSFPLVLGPLDPQWLWLPSRSKLVAVSSSLFRSSAALRNQGIVIGGVVRDVDHRCPVPYPPGLLGCWLQILCCSAKSTCTEGPSR